MTSANLMSDIKKISSSIIIIFFATGLEMFRKSLDFGQAGDQLGALIRGVKRDEVRRGMVMCAPGTVASHTKLRAQVYVLKKEEGGRHKPFVTGFQPQMFTRTADITVTMALPEGALSYNMTLEFTQQLH